MSLTLSYPRCYASQKWYSAPYTCGGLSKQFQHFVKFTADSPLEEISGWLGDVPTADFWQGPPNPAWEPKTEPAPPTLPAAPKKEGPGFLGLVKQFFDLGESATHAAKVAGYVAIASVGAGLLLWYVPRRK